MISVEQLVLRGFSFGLCGYEQSSERTVEAKLSWAQTAGNAKSYADDILEECERVCLPDESIIIRGENERRRGLRRMMQPEITRTRNRSGAGLEPDTAQSENYRTKATLDSIRSSTSNPDSYLCACSFVLHDAPLYSRHTFYRDQIKLILRACRGTHPFSFAERGFRGPNDNNNNNNNDNRLRKVIPLGA
ncbi:hypothetical protein KQX54_020775 [Cotesia glomerata]|uniref:Uncharacterized protein n=1 Tax=Cotesia glomerata TaxID=32391 RepID=A0AAV7HM91_COTGL|nr:hypothetical protein KQX54_020775 [Cotesia glomerata]